AECLELLEAPMSSFKSLCESCARMREVVTPKGSRFLLCQLSQSDRRYPKYPAQPVLRCGGYEPRREASSPPQSEPECRRILLFLLSRGRLPAAVAAQQARQRGPPGQPPVSVPQGQVHPSPRLALSACDGAGLGGGPVPGGPVMRLRPRQDLLDR